MRLLESFFVALICTAGIYSPCASAPRFTQYTSEQGLCNDFIRSLHRDHQGFLWIGSFDGLSIFDGLHFTTFKREFGNRNSLPSTTILDIKEDAHGNTWVATAKGICWYNAQTRQMVRANLRGADSLYLPYSLLFRGNSLWVVTQQSIDCFEYDDNGGGKLLYKISFPGNVDLIDYRRKIFSGNDGRIFVLGGYKFFSVDTVRRKLNLYELNDIKGQQVPVFYFIQDSGNKCWLMQANRQAIFLFDPSRQKQTITEAYSPGLPNDPEYRFISADKTSPDGNTSFLTLGTNGNGIFLFDINSKKFSALQYNASNKYGISNNQVNILYRDREGLLWIGTGYGLNLFDPNGQQLEAFFIDEAAADNMITDMIPKATSGENYWLGTLSNGILEYTNGGRTVRQYLLPAPIQYKIQYLFTQKNGDLWIGTEEGLYRKTATGNNPVKIIFKGEQPVSISCIMPVNDDSLVITSFENGCWIYNHKTGTSYRLTTSNGLFSNRCTNISSGNGKICITHISTGISIIDQHSGSVKAIPFQQFTEKELAYPSTFTYCSYIQNDSILWTGTGLGLVRYNYILNRGELIPVSTRLKTDSEIWSIIPDGTSFLWLKTTFGVYKFNWKTGLVPEFFPLERKHIRAQDGYFRMRQLNDSTLIIPAYQSFYKLALHTPVSQNILPAPVLTSLKLEDKYLHINSDKKNFSIELKPGESSINIQFVIPDFHHPEFITYVYRIEGGDGQWHRITGNELSFPNLKAGAYKLEIRAKDHNDYRSAPLIMDIVVHPYFWQTPWFYLLLTLTLALGFYGLYRYRIMQLMALQKIRQRISKDLHDDIGATVSSISILADIAGKKDTRPDKANQYLHTISEESKYVADALSDIVWTINPRNDSVQITFARLLRYATELMDAKNILYEIKMPEQGMEDIELQMEVRQHLYLILKEIINNLVKYSKASKAGIQVILDHSLQVTIQDNGIGFDMDRAQMGNGILNMKKRASAIGGNLTIASKPGQGTTVTLKIPISSPKNVIRIFNR